MLNYRHRDMLARIIQIDDYVAWGNGKYNQSTTICRVVGATTLKVSIQKPDGKITRVEPKNLLVITHQVLRNIEDHVGDSLNESVSI